MHLVHSTRKKKTGKIHTKTEKETYKIHTYSNIKPISVVLVINCAVENNPTVS